MVSKLRHFAHLDPSSKLNLLTINLLFPSWAISVAWGMHIIVDEAKFQHAGEKDRRKGISNLSADFL
jgi:hypothetical protein